MQEYTSNTRGKMMIWKPTAENPRPPGNPFGPKEKEKKEPQNQAQPARVPNPFIAQSYPSPPQSPDVLPEPQALIPMPEWFKEKVRELEYKMSLKDRWNKQGRPIPRVNKDGKPLSHLERLEYSGAADEDWFAKNQHKVNWILDGKAQSGWVE